MNNEPEPHLDLEGDLFRVRCALLPLSSKWVELALCLGLDYSWIEETKAKHGRAVDKCVTEVGVKWLRGGGRRRPSWEQLVKVITTEMGGNNPAYAEKVASHAFLEDVLEFSGTLDEKPLGMSNANEVLRALEQVVHNWMEIGICLGISYDLLEPLDQRDPQGSLAAVVQLWLEARYDTTAFGRPSWRKLVEVVGWRCGACNPSLAESIAKQHEATPIVLPKSQLNHQEHDKKHKLTPEDLEVIFDVVQGAHLHWKDIGRNLKMGHTETSSIVTTPGLTQTKDYFQELLHRWLKWAPPIHPFPTTEDLAEALRGVGSENIAYKLTKHNNFMSAARMV